VTQTFVSLAYPVIFHSPPVLRLTARFFVLLLPIGVLGFLSQILMTNGLIKEKAGRGALATCAFAAGSKWMCSPLTAHPSRHEPALHHGSRKDLL
jgi:hypothetical protein